MSDHSSVVAYINKQSGTLLSLASEVLGWAECNALSLSVVHLKGERNIVADFLSRTTLNESDWVLNNEVFRLITRRWGAPSMALFESRENAKAPLFFSLNRSEGALAVDALMKS